MASFLDRSGRAPRPHARGSCRCAGRPGCRAARPACRGRCRRTAARVRPASAERSKRWVIIPSYSGRGSHSGSASAPSTARPSARSRNSWPVHTRSGVGADALGHLGEDVADRHRLSDAVVDAGRAVLDAAHDPRRQVADVDELHAVLGIGRREHRAAIGQPLGPVAEAAGRVAGADDQAGPDHHRPRGAVDHGVLAGDLHRAVGLGVLAQVAVLVDRLDAAGRRCRGRASRCRRTR